MGMKRRHDYVLIWFGKYFEDLGLTNYTSYGIIWTPNSFQK